MTLEDLRCLRRAEPFQPFVLKLADGSMLDVPEPEFMSVSPRGTFALVATKRGGHCRLEETHLAQAQVTFLTRERYIAG